MARENPDPDVISAAIDAMPCAPNSNWQRWHAATVIAELFGPSGRTLDLLQYLGLTDVRRCAREEVGAA